MFLGLFPAVVGAMFFPVPARARSHEATRASRDPS
jgi:hypothetical protein